MTGSGTAQVEARRLEDEPMASTIDDSRRVLEVPYKAVVVADSMEA